MADVLSSGRVDNPEDIGPADKNPDPQKAQIATRRMLEEEVRLLRRQLVLMQEELEASRSTMRRGMIARKDSEVLLLKKKIAELMLAAQKLDPRHNGQGRETAKEQVAKRVEGYYNDVLSELGLDLSNLKRKVPHHLRFCEKSDGRMEAIAWIGCNGIQSAPDMHFFGLCSCGNSFPVFSVLFDRLYGPTPAPRIALASVKKDIESQNASSFCIFLSFSSWCCSFLAQCVVFFVFWRRETLIFATQTSASLLPARGLLCTFLLGP